MLRSKAGARLKAIRKAKSLGTWDKPYRMHLRLRDLLDERVEAELAAREEAARNRYFRNVIDRLRQDFAVLDDHQPNQPHYVQ